MFGLRLTSDAGANLVDEDFDANNGEWVTRDIPTGYEIIGLYMSKAGDKAYIQGLGFILWKPNLGATD